MESSLQVKIEYDDDQIEIIDKINEVLQAYHLKLQDDMQEHDGFIMLSLKEWYKG